MAISGNFMAPGVFFVNKSLRYVSDLEIVVNLSRCVRRLLRLPGDKNALSTIAVLQQHGDVLPSPPQQLRGTQP